MMRHVFLLLLLGLCHSVTAVQQNPEAQRLLEFLHGHVAQGPGPEDFTKQKQPSTEASGSFTRYLSNVTAEYVVNGTGIPDVDFDLGESYAGSMPISEKETDGSLYFWFVPTSTWEFRQKKEIVIWLNGGPGCSSLIGLLQENGPFLWQPGMIKPQENPWAFNRLTNVVWVEQPVKTGFSQGSVPVTDEDEIAKQFLGFWKNFADSFGIGDYDVYIAAESYGGMYGPYIAKHFIDDTNYNFKGLLIYDGLMFDRFNQGNVVSSSFMEMHHDIWPFDDNTRKLLHNTADNDCGFSKYEKQYLRYPPLGPTPISPTSTTMSCQSFNLELSRLVEKLNPCFSIYNVLDKCPRPYDSVMGKNPWFNRKDVKQAINAPNVEWKPCQAGIFKKEDQSPPSGEHALPYVIDKTQNVILAHGAMDFILPMNGVLLGIQNMTWGGKMGFQTAPKDPFVVPEYIDRNSPVHYDAIQLKSGTGIIGTTHHERGLTFVVTQIAGHMGPGDSPAGAFRHLEKLTGQIDSLSSRAPFTLPVLRNVTQSLLPLANGTVPIPCFGRGC